PSSLRSALPSPEAATTLLETLHRLKRQDFRQVPRKRQGRSRVSLADAEAAPSRCNAGEKAKKVSMELATRREVDPAATSDRKFPHVRGMAGDRLWGRGGDLAANPPFR